MRGFFPALSALFLAAGLLRADLHSGLRAFDSHDYGFAISQFVPLAEQGNPQAQNALGYLYEHGLGISKNDELAARWYRKSAEQGYGPGEYNYGLMCWKGAGVPKSDEQAIQWLLKASQSGVALAAFDLGTVYYKEGSGDITAALHWWKIAAERNISPAAYNLAYLYAEGPGVPHDYGQAAKWYGEAARQNYPLAQYALALLYRNGKGVTADPVEARMWLELAARAGLKEAKEEIDTSKDSWTPGQIALAQRKAAEWTPGTGSPAGDRFVSAAVPGPGAAPVRTVRLVRDTGPSNYWPKNTSTGYFVNPDGQVITSYAAVRGCQNIVLKTDRNEQHASLIGQDLNHGVALLAAEAGSGGAPGLSLADKDPSRDEKLLQVGYQLRGADAAAEAIVAGLIWKTSGAELTLGKPPDPPLAGGPVLDEGGRVIAFQVSGESDSHLVMAPELRQLLKNDQGPANHITGSAADLSGLGVAAKKNLVLVECKP